MILMINKQMKEFWSNKATVIFVFLFIIIGGVIMPVFNNNYMSTSLATFSFLLIVQIAPGLFTEEKENRTLETLLTTPLDMKSIYMGKVLFCTTLICSVLISSAILGNVIGLMINGKSNFNLFETLITYLLIIIGISNASKQSVYYSLKSNDNRGCSLKVMGAMFIYIILADIICMPMNLSFNNRMILKLIYFIIHGFIYIYNYMIARKYMDKVIIFSSFRL